VLTSGDHAKVAAWRRAEAERLTKERRPDLWAAHLADAGAAENAKNPAKKPDRKPQKTPGTKSGPDG
jgi:tRNA (guanine37-N1)-methyltransferase